MWKTPAARSGEAAELFAAADDEEDLPDGNPFESKNNLANSPAVSRKQKAEDNHVVGDTIHHLLF